MATATIPPMTSGNDSAVTASGLSRIDEIVSQTAMPMIPPSAKSFAAKISLEKDGFKCFISSLREF
jgi:hypothetical protein